ncbi:MAG: hypothetical protein ACRD3T_03440 [Terriglobia bacterium]
MDIRFRVWKRAIRQFLRTSYSDERLSWLLAHAQGGKLAYQSCCCLIGVATADHSLCGKVDLSQSTPRHYELARMLPGAKQAEMAFWELGYVGGSRLHRSSDELRRRRLIPMIRAVMRARERAARANAQLVSNLLREQSNSAAAGELVPKPVKSMKREEDPKGMMF